jgi:hypothetical protein
MAKYDPLETFLSRQKSEDGTLILTFKEIEALIGSALPPSAFGPDARAWQNEGEDGTHPQARAWWKAGYKVQEVKGDLVTFKRR